MHQRTSSSRRRCSRPRVQPSPRSPGTLDAFRLALGGINNGVVAGPLADGRREINWDGGGSTATSLAPTPFTGFLNSRGSLFTTPGTGFVQAPTAGLADTFGNPTYATIFQAFSPVRLFSAIDSSVTIVDFFIPGWTRHRSEHARLRRDLQ